MLMSIMINQYKYCDE